MRFETLPPEDAQGAILAHGVRLGGRLLRKGRTLDADDVRKLRAAGIERVSVVRLEAGDVAEDEAAARIARALGGEHIRMGAAFTGRANLYAREAGLVVLDVGAIDVANAVDEAITVATLPAFARVAAGDMIATVKIIPFAAPVAAVDAVAALAARSPVRVAAFRPLSAALIVTELPGQKPTAEKTRAALEARLAPLGGTLVSESRCAHAPGEVSAALRAASKEDPGLFFVMGASAITDRRDVIPAGIEAAGGEVRHFGMPVDPGNLLLLGAFGGKPVIGLPGCARSPKLNGFDFVLQRVFARLPVTGRDLMAMGVGGLLQEIPTRPQPRAMDRAAPGRRAQRIAAVVLAAGLSSRMGSNKLLAPWNGVPLLRRTVAAALASQAGPVLVVTGHEADRVAQALSGLDVQFVHNPDFAQGLSTSLRAGIAAVPDDCDGAMVLLGDMPEIGASLLDRMIAAFSPADGRAICVACAHGKRGNPVLWARRYFAEIETVTGDAGAKHLIGEHEDEVCEIDAGDDAFLDVDTPEALAALRRRSLKPAPT